MATISRRLEDRRLGHPSTDLYRLDTDEFALKGRLTVLQKHLDHFLEISVEFIERFSLSMRSGEARHISYIKPGIGIAFDHCGVMGHREGSIRLQSVQYQKSDGGACVRPGSAVGLADRTLVKEEIKNAA